MKIRKMASVIICAAGIIMLITLAFNNMNKHQPEIIKAQEEYQMELLKMLDRMFLLITPVNSVYSVDLPREEIAPGVEIFHEKLALYAHCYRLVGKTESIATKEDIAKLYNSYDEKLEEKFMALYRWWARQNGGDICVSYNYAIRTAFALYIQQYGPFNGKDKLEKMLAEDKIALEQFVRDNPDFMPKEVYYRELYELFIISGEELNALWRAAKEVEKQAE